MLASVPCRVASPDGVDQVMAARASDGGGDCRIWPTVSRNTSKPARR
jgi:hypothetical protein